MELNKQRGISLVVVVILSVAVGLLAVGTLVSMRQERNIFKEILHKASGGTLGAPAPAAAGGTAGAAVTIAPTAPGNTLRRCVINGKTVFSDTECANTHSTEVKSLQVKGVESPKVPPKPAPEAGKSINEKAIDRALQ
jgi:hypothetical protein